MKKISIFFRVIYIQYIWFKYGLDDLLTQHHRLYMFRFLIYLNPFFWFRPQLDRAVAIRTILENLGPLFIKFGQALSTRPDVLPPDIAFELSKLQDKVPPFSSDKVIDILQKAYQKPLHEVFSEFDIEPLASASIAQVHAARLFSGESVVVKIMRPDIRKTIQTDLNILKIFAKWVNKNKGFAKKFKPMELVREFEHNLMDEMDFNREGANASQLRRNFLNSPLLYVPEIYWSYTHQNVLVMERINGIPVNDIQQLKAHGVNLKLLAERGLEIFFTQVFRDCFFHADMHPGNIFVSKANGYNPQYICVDFGIVGTLNESDKYYLAQNLLAFFNRDYQRVAELHIASGWIDKSSRTEDFASAIRTVCEPIFEKPLKDISFATLMIRLIQVARRFHMEVQPQLILLQKTLLAVEGLGRQIYPDLDLWRTGKPFLEKWVKEAVGPKAFIKHIKANIPFLVEELPYMPQLIKEVLLLTKNHYNKDHIVQIKSNKKSLCPKTVKVLVIGALIFSAAYYLPENIDKTTLLAFLTGIGLTASFFIL